MIKGVAKRFEEDEEEEDWEKRRSNGEVVKNPSIRVNSVIGNYHIRPSPLASPLTIIIITNHHSPSSLTIIHHLLGNEAGH